MFADRNGTPKGPPANAANAEGERISEEISQQAASPTQPGEIRYKRRKRHRRRKRTKIEKRLIWDICLGGAVLAVIVLLLIALSKGVDRLPAPPVPTPPEIPTGQ
ncbi:MAG TPA: hypothetical protein VH595_00040 [Verrucomicrobiae bacterium]|jgi:cytochrome c-type biogenesis protein CcmH/NrfG|nr:hypothetical protein [Verrucomicrobiae bacterium]